MLTESRLLNRAIEKSLDVSRFAIHTFASDMPGLTEKLSSLSPDFIFSNTSLKESSGFALRDRLRALSSFQKTRFIFLSTDEGSTSQEEHAALKDGEHLLQIPFTTEAVSQLMSSLTSGKKTILYADDTKFFHNVVVPPLLEEGYEMVEAWDGKEALDIFQKRRVDMIITDVEMPNMDGFSLCRSVKKDLGRAEVPVLIVTSLDSEADVGKGFESGADDYITKPVVVPELVSRVRRMLNTGQTLRPEKIIVVDDSSFIRNTICQSLRAQGFHVDEAGNGEEALGKILSCSYALVVTDYNMPVMDGYELCLNIRQSKKVSDLPIIMVSDRESKAKLVKIRSTGVQACISKPFTAERLIAEVERILAHVRLQQQRRAMRHYLSDDAVDAVDRLTASGGSLQGFAWDKFRTVLFMDIVSFTPLCEKLSPREVVDILNIYFEKMVEVLIGYDAIIDKFIGDAILALFGRDADGAHRAVCAAWDMINALPALRAETGKEIHLRIGINSGQVVVGDIGSRLHRRDFTVIGDNVNTAQRLESAAPRDGILISGTTHQLIKNLVRVEATEPLKLKGKQEPLQAYRIKSVQPYEVQSRAYPV